MILQIAITCNTVTAQQSNNQKYPAEAPLTCDRPSKMKYYSSKDCYEFIGGRIMSAFPERETEKFRYCSMYQSYDEWQKTKGSVMPHNASPDFDFSGGRRRRALEALMPITFSDWKYPELKIKLLPDGKSSVNGKAFFETDISYTWEIIYETRLVINRFTRISSSAEINDSSHTFCKIPFRYKWDRNDPNVYADGNIIKDRLNYLKPEDAS